MMPDTRKPGRPVESLPVATCDRFLEWLESGRTLAAFSRAEGVSEKVLRSWCEKSEEFRERVAEARRNGHDRLAEEILAIADESEPDRVAVDRLRCDVRRWLLSRWSPERYGDAKTSGEAGATVVVVTGVPRERIEDAVERKTTPTGGRSPLAASRAGGEEHNISDTNISPSDTNTSNSPSEASQPRVTVEIDPPLADDPL